MNDTEVNRFEASLRTLPPAPPPPDFERRLVAARPLAHPRARQQQQNEEGLSWRQILRWLVPATALILAAGLLWLNHARRPGHSPLSIPAANGARLNADEVRIDHELVSAFDAIARLPEGEPVRFRYREWMDDVILRDSARGVVIHQRTPRVEVVPVRFETY
jgi:hypothetical protein